MSRSLGSLDQQSCLPRVRKTIKRCSLSVKVIERKETVPSIALGLLDSLQAIGSSCCLRVGSFRRPFSITEAPSLQTQQKAENRASLSSPEPSNQARPSRALKPESVENIRFGLSRDSCLLDCLILYSTTEIECIEERQEKQLRCDDSIVISETQRRVSDSNTFLVIDHRRSPYWLLSFDQAVEIRILRKINKCLLRWRKLSKLTAAKSFLHYHLG